MLHKLWVLHPFLNFCFHYQVISVMLVFLVAHLRIVSGVATRSPAALQTTTDASEQNNTGPLGG